MHRLTLKSNFILPNSGTAIVKHGDPGEMTAKLASLQRSPGKKAGIHDKMLLCEGTKSFPVRLSVRVEYLEADKSNRGLRKFLA